MPSTQPKIKLLTKAKLLKRCKLRNAGSLDAGLVDTLKTVDKYRLKIIRISTKMQKRIAKQKYLIYCEACPKCK